MTYRLVVKEIALKNGFYASFMPKPLKDQNGSGMHVHQSLFKGDKNAFYDTSDKNHLSRVAKHYIAGLLKRAPEMCLVTNQWVNSYKRLTPGYEAPAGVCWAKKNRSALVRIPMYKKGHEKSVRAELRLPDAACNPYLVFAVMLAAGLEGIKNHYELPVPVEENGHEPLESLPRSLGEAITIAEKSKFLKEALGEHIYHSLIEDKKIEWNRYCDEITDYELKEYLPIL